jgi:phosphatidylserine decarboxylase
VDRSELPVPVEQFNTFQEFFSRPLKDGARTIETGLVSPVDGTLVSAATCDSGLALCVKGEQYILRDLLAPLHPEQAAQQQYNVFHFYLSPKDYHRVHAPCDMTVLRVGIFAGDILPVNERSVRVFPRLFARNTRWVFEFQSEAYGHGYLVAVAALHVASFACQQLPDMALPTRGEYRAFSKSFRVKKGAELGSFLMGSSVILLSPQQGSSQVQTQFPAPGAIRLGQRLF